VERDRSCDNPSAHRCCRPHLRRAGEGGNVGKHNSGDSKNCSAGDDWELDERTPEVGAQKSDSTLFLLESEATQFWRCRLPRTGRPSPKTADDGAAAAAANEISKGDRDDNREEAEGQLCRRLLLPISFSALVAQAIERREDEGDLMSIHSLRCRPEIDLQAVVWILLG